MDFLNLKVCILGPSQLGFLQQARRPMPRGRGALDDKLPRILPGPSQIGGRGWKGCRSANVLKRRHSNVIDVIGAPWPDTFAGKQLTGNASVSDDYRSRSVISRTANAIWA